MVALTPTEHNGVPTQQPQPSNSSQTQKQPWPSNLDLYSTLPYTLNLTSTLWPRNLGNTLTQADQMEGMTKRYIRLFTRGRFIQHSEIASHSRQTYTGRGPPNIADRHVRYGMAHTVREQIISCLGWADRLDFSAWLLDWDTPLGSPATQLGWLLRYSAQLPGCWAGLIVGWAGNLHRRRSGSIIVEHS